MRWKWTTVQCLNFLRSSFRAASGHIIEVLSARLRWLLLFCSGFGRVGIVRYSTAASFKGLLHQSSTFFRPIWQQCWCASSWSWVLTFSLKVCKNNLFSGKKKCRRLSLTKKNGIGSKNRFRYKQLIYFAVGSLLRKKVGSIVISLNLSSFFFSSKPINSQFLSRVIKVLDE